MDGEVIIRPARPEDLPEVERICTGTWDWGDYIPEVWDRWLADEGSHVAVAEREGQIVALGRVILQPGGQAWLEGMRVDPLVRRQGIARRFYQYKLAYARARGARVVRLATGDYNRPVHRMMDQVGMARVGQYEMLKAEAQAGGEVLQTLSPQDAGAVSAFLRRSPMLAATHGLYCLDWAWQELSEARAVELLAAGQVVGRRSDNDAGMEALTLVERESDEQRLWVGFADVAPVAEPQAAPVAESQAAPASVVDPAALGALARDLWGLAARWGLKYAVVMLPDVPQLREAFRAADYGPADWEGELWIYELALGEVDERVD